MDHVYRGMTVVDAHGPVGVIEAIDQDPTTGAEQLRIQRDDGTRQTLTHDMYMVVGDVVQIDELVMDDTADAPLKYAADQRGVIDQQRGSPAANAVDVVDEITIPVVQEEVVIRTQEVEHGGVRVHKLVNEREEVIEQPTYHEQVDVERVPIGRVVDVAPQPREEGDTLILPVMEEMLVVEKRLVLKEEIRITRHRTQTTEQARVMLREEQVQIEDISERTADDPLR